MAICIVKGVKTFLQKGKRSQDFKIMWKKNKRFTNDLVMSHCGLSAFS